MMPEIMEFLTRSAGMLYKNMLFALLFAVLLGVYIFLFIESFQQILFILKFSILPYLSSPFGRQPSW